MKHTRVEDQFDLATGRGRLTYLAVVLDRAHALRQPFDLQLWQRQVDDCGTAACAMGWACREPVFKALGLTVGVVGTPLFAGESGFDAAAGFFGIPRSAAIWLFFYSTYASPPTAADVAVRIREMLAEGAP